MSKLDELGATDEALGDIHALAISLEVARQSELAMILAAAHEKIQTSLIALIERVEELERQLQSARKLAERITRYDDQCEPGATYHISEAVDWDRVVSEAREFLKLLEGK